MLDLDDEFPDTHTYTYLLTVNLYVQVGLDQYDHWLRELSQQGFCQADKEGKECYLDVTYHDLADRMYLKKFLDKHGLQYELNWCVRSMEEA